jgi:hypothetical protein
LPSASASAASTGSVVGTALPRDCPGSPTMGDDDRRASIASSRSLLRSRSCGSALRSLNPLADSSSLSWPTRKRREVGREVRVAPARASAGGSNSGAVIWERRAAPSVAPRVRRAISSNSLRRVR